MDSDDDGGLNGLDRAEDEASKRRLFLRKQVIAEEREKLVKYMSEQQYKTRMLDTDQELWIETKTDVKMRMEGIKAKIKGLTPDLYMKSDIDFNFIDKITARDEQREAFKHHLPQLAQDGKPEESEEDDTVMFRKVLPRETFDPPSTPDDREQLS